jgi:hypothetical protein
MILIRRIGYVRKLSIFLFLFTFTSIIGSLLLHNKLVEFSFGKTIFVSKKEIVNGIIFKGQINCSENISDCRKNPFLNLINVAPKLGDCHKNIYKSSLRIGNQIIPERDTIFEKNNLNNPIKTEYKNKNLELTITNTQIENKKCIKNSEIYKFYKIFPFYYDTLYNLKHNPKTKMGTNKKINPFIYGETSISNIVKRYPINYLFKSLLFIAVILMALYWKNYNIIFNGILKSEKNNFLFFGYASAIFLFFHVLFLGLEFDNKIFKLIRKLVIIFFILSEITSQILLTKALYKNKKNLKNFCNQNIINFKLFFVITSVIFFTFIIYILTFYDLTSNIDFIFEWNCFVGLLFFYLLSFFMWKNQKKLILNPSTT